MFGELYLFLIRGQFKYYVLFVDDCSCMAWYLMKGRKEVFSKFLSFMNEICTQYSASVITFRSDNALEYTSLQFKQYFNSRSIIHETSCVYTPYQNGVFERKHRHILEVTWCLVLHISVPKYQWPAALLTACYLINRMPGISIDNKIPLQVLFPDQPLFSLKPKTLGCECFVHILPTRQDKLSARSLKCVFLGYSRHQKGSICYHPGLKRTLVTVDVSFFETVPFYTPSTSSISPISTSPSPHFSLDSSLHSESPRRFADPSLVYTCRPKEDHRFGDPPIVYTRGAAEDQITPMD